MNPLWSTLNEPDFEVTYRDADQPLWRSYGDGGELIATDDVIIIQPNQRQASYVKWFGIVFTPIFILVGLVFIPSPEKWLFSPLAAVAGISTFVLIYGMVKQNIDAGPYLRVNLAQKTFCLPRLDLAFPASDLDHLQVITGHGSQESERLTDLNLIVRNNGLIRYFIMGSPNRKFVDQVSQQTVIPVIETTLGRHGRRDIDVTHKQDA